MGEPDASNAGSWAASPCSTCSTSPCCTRLPLHRFHIENRRDVERARTLLESPRIELGLYDTGWWMAYYLAPCRFLNPLDSKCLIHGSPRQPQICRDYSPVRCWYKRVFAPPSLGAAMQSTGALGVRPTAQTAAASIDFIRFDARRFDELERLIAFDDAGELASVPPWEELHTRLTALPLVEATSADHRIEWVAPVETGGFTFPIRTPRTKRDLDVVRFRLGFHGVRIGVNGEEWSTVIGSPPEAERYLLITYDQFEALTATFAFDGQGRILRAPHIAPAHRTDDAPPAPLLGTEAPPTGSRAEAAGPITLGPEPGASR